MNQKIIVAAVVVFVLIIGGMFWFANMQKDAEPEPQLEETPQTEETTPTPYDSITRINAKHFFIDGTHTVTGEIMMPTPCDLLDWDVTVAESLPEQVLIDFTVINTAESCPQVITPQRFMVTFDASENAAIRARLEGREVELNLIPAAPGETPDDFELFIKG